MCWNICKTFDAELPDSNIDMHNRKLPAGILVPGIFGWLFQTVSFLLHLLLVQVEVITAMVPTCFVSTSGLSALQEWQNLNRSSSWDRKTKNFGCFCSLLSLINTLWRDGMGTKQLFINYFRWMRLNLDKHLRIKISDKSFALAHHDIIFKWEVFFPSHLKMMSWQHWNVVQVQNSYHLFLFLNILDQPVILS